MRNFNFTVSGFIKKYPKLAILFLAILVFDIVYYFGKEIGRTLYYLTHL
ncbi:hypothetical protein PUR_41880 [Paenibacillus sp. URB8-2]|nr:hypothetical protein PUR_41880 [Paenibacillus sp. URB8-2]